MNSVPSQEKPPDPYPPLSEAETQAIEILTGYGIDFAPAYIGRARAWQKNYAIENPSAQQIVDQCMELIKFDEEQKAYLKRRREEMGLSNLYNELADKLASTEPATMELVKALKAEVQRERFNKGWTPVELEMYETQKSFPLYIGIVNIGGTDFIATAFRDRDKEGRSILRVQIKPE